MCIVPQPFLGLKYPKGIILMGFRSLFLPNCDPSWESIKQIRFVSKAQLTDNNQDAGRHHAYLAPCLV